MQQKQKKITLPSGEEVPKLIQPKKSKIIDENHRENGGNLGDGRIPSFSTPPQKSPLKYDIPNKYPLQNVYMGLHYSGHRTIFPTN